MEKGGRRVTMLPWGVRGTQTGRVERDSGLRRLWGTKGSMADSGRDLVNV